MGLKAISVAVAFGILSSRPTLFQKMNANLNPYRGSEKHKNLPAYGAKGTLCPKWTHSTPAAGLGNKPFHHDWSQTQAQQLLLNSLPDPNGNERCYATMRGIAFEAKPSNDGTWHGYPIPWESVPDQIKDTWLEQQLVTRRQIKQHKSHPSSNIKWALDGDEK